MPSISKYHAAEPRQTLSHLSSEAPQLSFGYGAGGAATVLLDRLRRGRSLSAERWKVQQYVPTDRRMPSSSIKCRKRRREAPTQCAQRSRKAPPGASTDGSAIVPLSQCNGNFIQRSHVPEHPHIWQRACARWPTRSGIQHRHNAAAALSRLTSCAKGGGKGSTASQCCFALCFPQRTDFCVVLCTLQQRLFGSTL